MGAAELVYRFSAVLTLAICGVLAFRLAVVVVATPTDRWMLEFVPMVDDGRAFVVEGLVVEAAGRISDPALARELIGDCITRSASPLSGVRASCMAAIDYALLSSPASSELWLAKARLYALQGMVGEEMAQSVRNSYATGRREGWVAAERLPFALRMRSFLPADLVEDIGGDVMLVLSHRQLAGPLIQAYVADPFLREATWPVIEQFATLDQQEALIGWIRARL